MPYRDPGKKRKYDRKWRAVNPEKSREYSRKWRAANLEKHRETSRKWRAANPEKVRETSRKANRKYREANPEYDRKWRAANPEKKKESSRKWKAANPEYERNRQEGRKEYFRKYVKHKRATDPNWRLIKNLRTALCNTLQGRRKSVSTMEIIGCTAEELFEHFESCSTWEPWMTRESYGKGGWDVDHIIPIAKWDPNCPVQIAKCWHKSNLQPLEHIENIKKGAR